MSAIRGLGIAALVAAVVVLLLLFGNSRPGTVPPTRVPPDGAPSVRATRSPTPGSGGVFMARRVDLDEGQWVKFTDTFQTKLKPAIQAWCDAYDGHVPFGLEDVTADCLHGQIGRGTSYWMYTFMVKGVTLGVEERAGIADVSYLNAPDSKKLMQLPNGTPPDPSVPVTRQEIAAMLRSDSGQDFNQAEIRVIPTAFSSAMSGGAHVNVGGDPINAASWKFTLVFGSDGKLNYYCKGTP